MKKLFAFQHSGSVVVAALMAISLACACRKDNHPQNPEKESAEVATDWYRLQLRILLERNSSFNGVHFGYIGIGLYEAVRNGIKGSVSLSSKLYQMPAMPQKENNEGYSWPVSANAALASMVRSFYGGLTPENNASIDSLEAAYNEKFSPNVASAVFTRSQTYGRSVATAIHDWFLTDNYNVSNAGYIPPVFPGSWVPTPPALVPIPVSPYVKDARPFIAVHSTTIAAPFPLAYDETPGSLFYNMVKQVYDVSLALTPEQKATALFWVDQGNSLGYTPPGHDFFVLTQALEQTNASLAVAAETYAKGGIAERDATIVCFRSKYANNLVRPVTYIQKLIDAKWLPFIGTPPHPEYPAAHAFVTGAVMQAAARVMGNNVTVTDRCYEFRGYAAKTFTNLFSAGEDAGISRLYGGIHYQVSIETGLQMAKELGDRVGDIQLK